MGDPSNFWYENSLVIAERAPLCAGAAKRTCAVNSPVASAASFSKSLSPSGLRFVPLPHTCPSRTQRRRRRHALGTARHIAPRRRGHIPHFSETATTGDQDRLIRRKKQKQSKATAQPSSPSLHPHCCSLLSSHCFCFRHSARAASSFVHGYVVMGRG
jgi:hypothetical protein